jgi:hypothetical protein
MLAKKPPKKQVTLPKAMNARRNGADYLDESTDGECIILRPLQNSRAEEVRTRLAQFGIDDEDVNAAISWVRQTL